MFVVFNPAAVVFSWLACLCIKLRVPVELTLGELYPTMAAVAYPIPYDSNILARNLGDLSQSSMRIRCIWLSVEILTPGFSATFTVKRARKLKQKA
ncbi:hypothetical protein V2G26_006608 [Clonostachys chloroleuca]